MARTIECTFGFRISDSLPSIRAFIKALQPAEDRKPRDSLTLDLSSCDYLGPFGAALLSSVYLDLTKRGHVVGVTPPLEPSALRAFWNFSGLEELMSKGKVTTEMDPDKHPNLPLMQVEKASFQSADPILRLVHAYQRLSEDWEEALRTCVNEIVQNI